MNTMCDVLAPCVYCTSTPLWLLSVVFDKSYDCEQPSIDFTEVWLSIYYIYSHYIYIY